MTSKFLLVIIKQQLPVNVFVTIICHQGLAIHHPSYRPVILTPIHLLILSGISYAETIRLIANSSFISESQRLEIAVGSVLVSESQRSEVALSCALVVD